MEESLGIFIIPEKSRKNLFCRERRRQRQISAGDSFRQAENIRRHTRVLAGEHLSGTAETGGNFIEDKKDMVRAADLT